MQFQQKTVLSNHSKKILAPMKNKPKRYFLFWCIFIFSCDRHSGLFQINIWNISLESFFSWVHIFTWDDSEYSKSYKIWSTLFVEGGVTVFIFDPLAFSNTFHEKGVRKANVSNMLHHKMSVSNTKVDQSEKLRNGSIIFVWISRWNIRLGIFKSKKVCFDKSIENAVSKV